MRDMENGAAAAKNKARDRPQKAKHTSASSTQQLPPQDSPDSPTLLRLNKALALYGVCSRRMADRLIALGRVSVDGQVVRAVGTAIAPGQRVAVDDTVISNQRFHTRIYIHHKKKGVLVSSNDPSDKATLFHHLRAMGLPRVVSVGRLDYNSEGLLLLTNDGELARHLELPDNAYERQYRVKVHGKVTPEKIASLARGITIKGFKYKPIIVRIEKQMNTNVWLHASMREGKNRELRRVFAELHWQVSQLHRIKYGPYSLGRLRKGDVREVPLLGRVKKFVVERDTKRREKRGNVASKEEGGHEMGGRVVTGTKSTREEAQLERAIGTTAEISDS
eukprot:TRINITY_DN18414_c0_g1_i1.p1 TRINITY_DN18414_c0_g1~~TRINITY_DN18414_c0_g1_i1.p1  ORF type:complete len:354 (-),score=87.69 TRINITY_DN18414_c0_g1_i1:17-1018(-)